MTNKRKKPDGSGIRNRIKEHRRVRAGDLIPNENNFRLHPDAQRDALVGLYQEVGFARSLLAYELPDGSLKLIDGHLRAGIDPEQEVEVEVLDVNESEARLLLASIDPLAALAETNREKLDTLLREVQTGSGAIGSMLAELAEKNGILQEDDGATELKQLDTRTPPKMSWVLLGIPTVRFGEIAADVERLATLPGILIETTVNDG